MRWLAVLLVGCSYTSPGGNHSGDAAMPAADAPPVIVDAVQIDGASDAAPPPPDAPTCPNGFASLPNLSSQYRAITTGQSYTGAGTACAALGARSHLARLDSQAEANAVFKLLDDAIATGDTHIYRVVGHRHANGAGSGDDTWHDLDDVTPLAFQPWGQGEPTNLSGENCMSLRLENFGSPPAKVTGADDCTTARAFACECD